MRRFVASILPDKQGRIILTEKEKRYLVNVLRIKKDSPIDVVLPNGVECSMILQYAKKKTGVVELVTVAISDSAHAGNADDEIDLWLFQFLPKGQKMDLIIRQATECGVKFIVPIVGDYSVIGKKIESPHESSNKVDRWMRIVREAKQQSGSLVDTKVFSPCDIKTAMHIWVNAKKKAQEESLGFVLCEKEQKQKSIFTLLHEKKDFSGINIGLAVGCEGGISNIELEILQKNSFRPIHFCTNILRAETAALYGLAVLQTSIGEYNIWKELNE